MPFLDDPSRSKTAAVGQGRAAAFLSGLTTQAIEQPNVTQATSAERENTSGTDPDKGSLRVCAVSFKPCWQEPSGRWMSSGGFPLQMRAIGSLFGEMTLVVVRGEPLAGGIPLPARARVVALREPVGADARRKLSVLCRLPYYLFEIAKHTWRADAIHVPVPGDIPLLGMLVALMFRKRLIVRYCSSWETTNQTTIMNRFTKWLMRTLAGGRNVMLATGGGETAPAEGVEWIFATALSRQEFAGIEPALDRGLSAPPQLAYVGRLSREKGVDNLVRAVGRLKESGFQPLPQVTLIGDGPQRGELEQLVAGLRCGEHIRFAGQLDREALSRQLSETDFCVQPSLTEGFSKAWLDAMAHGLPVLASDVGAAASVIEGAGERGWLVPAGDVTALVAKLEDLLSNTRDWPALRRRCREHVQQITLEAWAERIGDLSAKHWNVQFSGGQLRR